MGLRSYIGAAIGFLIGFLIAQWFVHDAPPSDVLMTMQTVCAFVGAIGGFAAGAASKAGHQSRALLAAIVGLVGCLMVGVAIWIYRRIFL